jgi:hypothetical protein
MIRKIAAVAAIAVASALGLGAQAALAAPAHAPAAGPTASQARAWVAAQVRGLLKYNPGAKQISSNAVRYKGAVLGVGRPGQSRSATPNSESGVCPGDNLCLFWDINFDEGDPSTHFYWIKFYNCNVNYNLYNYRLSTGLSWADQASSIDYPGSADGHLAKFNHDGNWWFTLYRDHYLANLTLDGGPSPKGNSNDWITGLYAC